MGAILLEGPVKSLLKILIPGLLLFVAVAVVQEWSYFSNAWFGSTGESAPELTKEDEQAAVGALRMTHALMAHLYASSGDGRYSERMPVSERVLDEMQSDIAYLARNGRVQEPRLQKLELLSVVSAGAGRLEINTREFWIHRTFRADGGGEADPPRSVILNTRYRLSRESRGWQIVDRDFRPAGGE